jgi:hypothetical protein
MKPYLKICRLPQRAFLRPQFHRFSAFPVPLPAQSPPQFSSAWKVVFLDQSLYFSFHSTSWSFGRQMCLLNSYLHVEKNDNFKGAPIDPDKIF